MIAKPDTWKVALFAELELPYRTETLQGFVIDGQKIWTSQGVKSGTTEDTWLALHVSGARTGTAILKGAGHGSIIGHLGGGRLVLDYDGRLVEFPWRTGTITNSSGLPTFGGRFQTGPVHATIDRRHSNALFYNSETKRTVLRSLADVKAQRDRPLGRTGPLTNVDRNGRQTLRQGWGSWGLQLLYLIGDHAGSQELLSYQFGTGADQVGRLLWRLPVKLRQDRTWEEPQGLFVSDDGVLSGDPLIFIGYTNRIYRGALYVREHLIYRFRNPNSRLESDLGYYYVDPAKVAAGSFLPGLDADGNVIHTRKPNERLWIERIEERFGRSNAVTTHGTYYDLDYLLQGVPPA